MPSSPTRGSRPVLVGTIAATLVVLGVAAVAARRGERAPHPIAPEPGIAVAPVAAPGRPMSLADASRHVSIEMYSAAWCSACRTAKAWLQQQGIAYHEVDVDRGQGALAQLQMLNPQRTLPTFDVDGRVIVGFEEPQLRLAIEQGAARAQPAR